MDELNVGVELRHLAYAVAVAEELHFGRAADRLRVAQPSLSRQIRDLERALGVELFRRTSRRVELTPAGAAFLAGARRTLQAAADSREAAVAAAHGVRGRVSLGFVASAAVEILPNLVAAHRTARPEVHLTLAEMTTDEQVQALINADIDVGISRDLEPVEGLRVRALHREPLVAAVPASHPLADKRHARLRDLVPTPFVSLPRERVPRAWDKMLAMCHHAGLRPQFSQDANQFVTLLALVAAGLGVAVVPKSVSSLRADDVRYLDLDEPEAWTEVTTAVRADEAEPVALDLHELLRAGTDHGPIHAG